MNVVDIDEPSLPLIKTMQNGMMAVKSMKDAKEKKNLNSLADTVKCGSSFASRKYLLAMACSWKSQSDETKPVSLWKPATYLH